jgi:bacteriocin biosynthesis cyclodehydratase domain-containing protein
MARVDRGTYLRIKRQYSVVAHSPDVVELRCGVWNPVSFTLTDETGSRRLSQIVKRLDGSLDLTDVGRGLGMAREDMEALADHLLGLGVAETGPGNALDHYLDTLIPTLARPGAGESPPAVVLLGDRGLAAEVKRLLAASSPGAEPVLAGEVGPDLTALGGDRSWLLDGAAFEQKLSAFEPWRGAFLVTVFKTIDPGLLNALNRVALALGVPWLHAAVDGPFLLVGPLFIPRRTACYACFETRVAMNLRHGDGYRLYKQALVEGSVTEAPMPVEPVLAGMLASHTAFEALNFTLTGAGFSVGKVLSIHLPTFEFAFNEVLRVPGCPACGPSPEAEDPQLYFDLGSYLGE